MALDENLWKLGITNQFSTYTAAVVQTGSTYLATATITIGGALVAKSAIAGSKYAAYRDLFQRVHEGQEELLPKLTTTQRDALSSVQDGRTILNITTGRIECCLSGSWVNSGGEVGGLVHLATSTVTTTDNTQTTLATVTLDAGSAYLFTAEIIGETTDYGTVLGAVIKCTAKRTAAGSAVLVGSVSTPHEGKDSGASSWSVTYTVSGNDLRVSVTGGNATTVNWEADLNYLKY